MAQFDATGKKLKNKDDVFFTLKDKIVPAKIEYKQVYSRYKGYCNIKDMFVVPLIEEYVKHIYLEYADAEKAFLNKSNQNFNFVE